MIHGNLNESRYATLMSSFTVMLADSREANMLVKNTAGQIETVEGETSMPIENESQKMGDAIDEGAVD